VAVVCELNVVLTVMTTSSALFLVSSAKLLREMELENALCDERVSWNRVFVLRSGMLNWDVSNCPGVQVLVDGGRTQSPGRGRYSHVIKLDFTHPISRVRKRIERVDEPFIQMIERSRDRWAGMTLPAS
jgi:hypothetical protein